jgi:hypothetical protein
MYPAQYLRRKAAAEYLKDKYGVGSTATLSKLATLGGGPVFQKLGRIPVYLPNDLDAWARGRITGPHQSTSDHTCRTAPQNFEVA